MAQASQDRLEHASDTAWLWGRLRPQFRQRIGVRAPRLLPLLLSTALAEVAGGIVYVTLLEKAFELGGGVASVGGVLMVQSIPQVLLGIWAGEQRSGPNDRSNRWFLPPPVRLLRPAHSAGLRGSSCASGHNIERGPVPTARLTTPYKQPRHSSAGLRSQLPHR